MRLLRRLWFVLTLRRQEDDLAEEMRIHREMAAEATRANSAGDEGVQAAVQRRFGNDLLARERSRDVWIPVWLQDVTKDVTFGIRMLAKDRRFTVAAILALALGIGVNNSVFTIINAALFRPLPFEEPERLISVRLLESRGDSPMGGGFGISYGDFLDWSRSATSFEGLMADQMGTMNVSEDGRSAERLRGAFVTANTPRLLRVTPPLGRDFVAEDDRAGAPWVAMLAYELWQSRYGGDPAVIGRQIRINSNPATIVGVMPPQFGYPMMAQIWLPLGALPNLDAGNRAARNLNVVGRLTPSADISRARDELEALTGQIAQAFPEAHKGLRLDVQRLRDAQTGARQGYVILGTLMTAVTMVLLIACANVASLMLARAAHRAREIAVRASLGASRWRIVRQLLIECTLMSAIAAVLGLGLSRYLASLMAVAFRVYDVGAPGGTVKPYWVDLSLDAVTMTFIGFLVLAVSVAVGIVPSWHLSRTNVNDVLKDGGRGTGSTVRARRLTGILLVGQLALTLVLLTGAGLLARNYFRLYLTDLVVDTSGVVTMRIVLPVPKYADIEKQRHFIATLDERLSALPLFSSVALGSDIPLQPLGFGTRNLQLDGQNWPAGEEPPLVFYVAVGPRYLETLRLPLIVGRAFVPSDQRAGQEGVIVNQRFAAKFFPDGSALGKRVRLTSQTITSQQSPSYTIVGIAQSLPNFMTIRAAEPVVYVPITADPGPQRAVSVIVRSVDRAVGKATAATALREVVTAIDPDLPVFGIQTLDEAVAMGRYSPQVIGSWFATIALVALVLAAVGIYALTAHGVTQRAQEIGVRMALGARSGQVIWIFMRRTIVQLVIGLALGIAGAWVIGRMFGMFLGDTNPRDPLMIAIVSGILAVVALTASVWPARKASRIDPVEALRAD
jgi:putative ABC transport system permease protein